MREMKQTGIKWIPELSSDFSIGYVKQFFVISKNLSKDGEPERVLKLARSGIVEKDVTANEGQMAASYEGYNKVEVGDLLLNPMDLYSGANCNVSNIKGVISPAYSNLRAKNANTVVPKYYDYFFKCQYWLMAMFAHGKGVSFDNRWTLNNDTLRAYKIPVPNYETQKRIVEKIQEEELKIDTLITNQQSQIEKLKAYKQSLITEVVTKGLDPTVPMKDSGVEWIGKTPKEWKLSKIASLYTMRNEKVSDKDYPPLSVTMKGIVPQLETAAKSNSHDDRKLVKKGDFAINSRSDRRGSCGISDRDGSVSLINTILAPRLKMHPQYYNWLFHTSRFSDEFYRWGHGIVDDLWTTRWQEMKKIEVVVPSLEVQSCIADYLDQKCSHIDRLISIKQQKIEKLNQYKKSLIYEYVTGKKEVI